MADISNLYAGYTSSKRFAVPKNRLARALKPYNLALSSLKGKSDAELRSTAANAVVQKYLKSVKK